VVRFEIRSCEDITSSRLAGERGSSIVPQAQDGLERGEIRWRDLIDFGARYRRETINFC